MDATTITVSLPNDVLRSAERIASERNVSVDALVTEMLSQFVQSEDEYAAAREDHLSIMSQGFDLGTHGKPPWTRDDLHER